MTDLAGRIRAKVDDRRAFAEAARPWPPGWAPRITGDSDSADRAHIAANDPERIIRDCDLVDQLLEVTRIMREEFGRGVNAGRIEVVLAEAWGVLDA